MSNFLRTTLLAAIAITEMSAVLGDELLVTSFNSDRVGRYDATDFGYIGPYEQGVGLNNPLAARIGPDGLLYVTSEGSDSVQRYDPATGDFVDTFVKAKAGGLDEPTGVTWNADGDLFVSSFATDQVLKYDGKTGESNGVFVKKGAGQLDGPDNGTIFGPDGDLYVPSYWNNRVLKYDGGTGDYLGAFVASIGRPRVIEFRGDYVYITSETTDAVRRYRASDGKFVDNFVKSGAGGLDVPVGLAFLPDGSIAVSSVSKSNVLIFSGKDGTFIEEALSKNDGGIDGPTFLTVIPEPSSAAILLLAGIFCRPARARSSTRRH